MSAVVKVRSAQIFYGTDNRPKRFFDTITGFGEAIFTASGIVNSEILNPTGFQPAIYYKTGLLTGFIPTGYSFTWQNLSITGYGEPQKVFLNYVTGSRPATGIITFNENLLSNNDSLNINGINFIYSQTNTGLFFFSSAQNLIRKLNSGATGAYNNEDGGILQNNVGVTGYRVGNQLRLFSYFNIGDSGNNNYIIRNTDNINAIIVPHRYFRGGNTLRPSTNQWTGEFVYNNNLTIENSGIYSKNINEFTTIDISGVIWEDNFDKNYYIRTGFKDVNNPDLYTGVLLHFNTGLNKYTGITFIPPNYSRSYSILNIEISKPNPYNISGNISKYTVSGEDFLFTGLIEG